MTEKSYNQRFLESLAIEAQEDAAAAYERYASGRVRNPPALDLINRQNWATWRARDARKYLWRCLGYLGNDAP